MSRPESKSELVSPNAGHWPLAWTQVPCGEAWPTRLTGAGPSELTQYHAQGCRSRGVIK